MNSTFFNSDCFNPDDFAVFIKPPKLIGPMIEENHYSHRMPVSPWHCFGVYQRDCGLIGALVYGEPVKAKLHEDISPLLKHGDLMELLRVWIKDGPKLFNIESWSIGQTFQLLKYSAPQVKMLVSYSDPYQKHKGQIYRATNWWYQNTDDGRMPGSFSVSFNKSPRTHRNDWIHSRTLSRRYGTSNPKRLAQMCGHAIMVKPDSRKYRYVYFLCGKVEANRLKKSLYIPATKEYPNQPRECPEIQVVSE